MKTDKQEPAPQPKLPLPARVRYSILEYYDGTYQASAVVQFRPTAGEPESDNPFATLVAVEKLPTPETALAECKLRLAEILKATSSKI